MRIRAKTSGYSSLPSSAEAPERKPKDDTLISEPSGSTLVLEQLEQINPDNPVDEQQKIRRYFPTNRFKEMVETNKHHFARLQELSDRTEGRLTTNAVREIERQHDKSSNEIAEGVEKFTRRTIAVSCWTEGDEGEQFWKNYAPDGGVMLETTVKDLYLGLGRQSVSDGQVFYGYEPVTIGRVKYEDKDVTDLATPQMDQSKNLIFDSTIYIIKEPKYEWEQEIRFAITPEQIEVITNGSRTEYEKSDKGFYVPIRLNRITIGRLVLSSHLDKETEYELLYLIKKAPGFHDIPIFNSSLHPSEDRRSTEIKWHKLITPHEIRDKVKNTMSIFGPFVKAGWEYEKSKDFGEMACIKTLELKNGETISFKVTQHLAQQHHILEILGFCHNPGKIYFDDETDNADRVLEFVEITQSLLKKDKLLK